MEEKLKEVKQDRFEVIVCVFNPQKQKWRCLSASHTGIPNTPLENRHEILEVDGKKFCNEYELIGFKPEEGKVSWISMSRDGIIDSLCKDIRSLVEGGRSTWEIWKEKHKE